MPRKKATVSKPAHLVDPKGWLAAYEERVYHRREPTEFEVIYEDNEQYRDALRREARQPDWDPKYAHDSVDMAEYHNSTDCETLEDVRMVIEALRALPPVAGFPEGTFPEGEDSLPAANVYDVRRRTNIHDVTPAGDPSGLLWDFDDDYEWRYTKMPDWLKELLDS